MGTTKKKPTKAQRSDRPDRPGGSGGSASGGGSGGSGGSGRPAAKARSVMQRQQARERARRRAWIAAGVAAVLLVVAGIGGWYAYQSQRPDPKAAAAPPPAGADAAGVRFGTAPVTVDVYLDFICPHCRDFEERASETLAGLIRDGKATVVYHPLAFLDSASSTKYSTRSAAASGCAADAGKFVEYAGALYAQQPAEGSAGLSETQLINLGAAAGIDSPAFGECVRADRHVAWVDGVTEEAVKRGIRGTPAVLVNGKQVDADPKTITDAVAAAS
jgi:protein-disulfide isomerase